MKLRLIVVAIMGCGLLPVPVVLAESGVTQASDAPTPRRFVTGAARKFGTGYVQPKPVATDADAPVSSANNPEPLNKTPEPPPPPSDDVILEEAFKLHQAKQFDQAFKKLQPLAEQGNGKAQYMLAVMYFAGEGVTQDQKEAARLLRLSAKQRYSESQFFLAVMYLSGQGVDKNLTEAAHWYRQAAEQGHVMAQTGLANLYGSGQGVSQNSKEAVKWYRLAAEQGNAEAQLQLGVAYLFGKGVTKDTQAALKWAGLSAQQNYTEAQYLLARLHESGDGGVKQDSQEAVKWALLAADQGHVDAQYMLGLMYSEGRGVARDFREGAKWYRIAADKGSFYALTNLGELYRYATDIPNNRIIALALYIVASSRYQGDPGNDKSAQNRQELSRQIGIMDVKAGEALAKEMIDAGSISASIDSYVDAQQKKRGHLGSTLSR